jgi:hypothetical protein
VKKFQPELEKLTVDGTGESQPEGGPAGQQQPSE